MASTSSRKDGDGLPIEAITRIVSMIFWTNPTTYVLQVGFRLNCSATTSRLLKNRLPQNSQISSDLNPLEALFKWFMTGAPQQFSFLNLIVNGAQRARYPGHPTESTGRRIASLQTISEPGFYLTMRQFS